MPSRDLLHLQPGQPTGVLLWLSTRGCTPSWVSTPPHKSAEAGLKHSSSACVLSAPVASIVIAITAGIFNLHHLRCPTAVQAADQWPRLY